MPFGLISRSRPARTIDCDYRGAPAGGPWLARVRHTTCATLYHSLRTRSAQSKARGGVGIERRVAMVAITVPLAGVEQSTSQCPRPTNLDCLEVWLVSLVPLCTSIIVAGGLFCPLSISLFLPPVGSRDLLLSTTIFSFSVAFQSQRRPWNQHSPLSRLAPFAHCNSHSTHTIRVTHGHAKCVECAANRQLPE